MKVKLLDALVFLLWPEIRLFVRWCIHSGHCSQAVREKDYNKFVIERESWLEKERENERQKSIYK